MSTRFNEMEKSFEKLANDIYEYRMDQNKCDEISDQFVGATSDEEWVELAYRHMKEMNVMPYDKTTEKNFYKSAEESTRIRNQGNLLFMKKTTLREALLLYTKSIAIAPYPSTELALAFGNRSAVLHAMKKYDACLKDIDKAILFHYPDTLKCKLLERQARCFEHIGMIHFQKARESFQCSLEYLPLASNPPSDDKIRDITNAMELLQVSSGEQMPKFINGNADLDYTGYLRELPHMTYGQHEDIACFSGALTIKSCPTRGGRYVEATKDIKPGDTLSVEKPYASIVWPEYCYTHCNGCLRRSDSMVPCEHCNTAMFCSLKCRDSSWTKFHQIECQMIPALLEYHSEATMHVLLALRMLITASKECHNLSGLKERLMEQQTSDKLFLGAGQFTPLEAMHSLMRHSQERSKRQLFEIAITSACIVNCLDVHTDFFSHCNTSPNWKLFVGGVLMRFHQIVTCNSFSVVDCTVTVTGDDGDENRRTNRHVQYGSGIYIFGAMVNHSCGPNTFASYHQGGTQVAVATRPIRRGEEMLFSYGPKYSTLEIAQRKSILKEKYFFECQCEACSDRWPVLLNAPSKRANFLCSKCRILLPEIEDDSISLYVQCKGCKEDIDLHQLAVRADSVIKILGEIRRHLNQASKPLDGLISDICKYLFEIDESVQRPSNIFFYGEELLKLGLAHAGNYYQL